MTAQSVQTVLFPELFGKPLVAPFDTPQLSSDGGAILRKAVDERLGLTARLAGCLREWRQAGKIEHALPTLVRQRCYGLACGYPDGFATPKLFDDLEAEDGEYLIAMANNARWAKGIRRPMGKARMRSKASGPTETLCGETRYAARAWSRTRRVILKAEVVRLSERAPRNNPRFVGTTLAQTPAHGDGCSRDRGDVENRIKELHAGLARDRTSGSDFTANAFRVLLTAAASVLLQALRRHLTATPGASPQVGTLRERRFTLGTRGTVSARRIVLPLPSPFPWLATWTTGALALGARSG